MSADRPARGRRLRWVALLLAVAMVACGGSGGEDAASPATAEAGVEVALEMVGSTGDDPFAESVAIDETAEFPEAVAATISATAATFEPDAATGGVTTTAATPGLYGGSQDEAVCDVEQLTAFLTDPANVDKAAAFTSTLGISMEDLVGGFLSALTPVVLTTDTLVTNHGFRDGEANPFPAVLQAGTAVLVDGAGVPRVKCNCGNPLDPPPTDADLGATTGDPWPGYDAGTTNTITAAPDALSELTVVDTATGDTYQRPAGAAGPAEPIDLANILLPAGSCGQGTPALQLSEGSGAVGDRFSVEPGFLSATLGDDPLSIDVDGDGRAESIIDVACNDGANINHYYVLALRAGPEGVAELVGAPLEPKGSGGGYDLVSVNSIAVENGTTLVVEGDTYAESDPICCPSLTETSRWVWKDGVWMGVS